MSKWWRELKLLLDECVDRRFARELQGHTVKTVPQMGWAGKKNGELLALAQQEFDVFITVDRALASQQNLSKFNIAVFILQATSNRLVDLKPLAPRVMSALPSLKVGQAYIISA